MISIQPLLYQAASIMLNACEWPLLTQSHTLTSSSMSQSMKLRGSKQLEWFRWFLRLATSQNLKTCLICHGTISSQNLRSFRVTELFNSGSCLSVRGEGWKTFLHRRSRGVFHLRWKQEATNKPSGQSTLDDEHHMCLEAKRCLKRIFSMPSNEGILPKKAVWKRFCFCLHCHFPW